MVNKCENQLVCDLAETYHVLEMKALPLTKVAVLADGLRENSRVRLFLSGERYTLQEAVQVLTYDSINRLVWLSSADGAKGKNRPESLAKKLFEKKSDKDKVQGFATAIDFEEQRQRLIEGS